ncbi:hypothetical protein D9M69_632230 [compost metagenome]
MELFYRVDAWRGELSMRNLLGLGGDEFEILDVAWVPRAELPRLESFYPAELLDDVWDRLATAEPVIRHLGLQV